MMDEVPFLAAVDLPDSDDRIVLLDPEVRPDGVLPWHPYQNLVRLGLTGEIVWRAELVPAETAAKCWTGVKFDGVLRAWTYSWKAVIDLDTGRIVESVLTK